MALEAQLCPQCGATVQFADLQTQAACPYCGTSVAKTEPQEVLKVNDLKELSDADNQKLTNLVLDGRRPDAIYFIRHYTGLGEAHAEAAIDNIITGWDSDHVPTGAVSAGRLIKALIILGINVVILIAIVAYFAWVQLTPGLRAGDRSSRMGAGLGVCGGLSAPALFWWAFSFFYLQTTWQQLQVSLSRRRAKTVPGRLQKVVPLKPVTDKAGAIITTRLVVEVPAAAGQAASVVELALDLPPATAQSLKPGAQIEVVSTGPAFTYIPTPLKVVG